MEIRKAVPEDLEIICGIYGQARRFMRESGNPYQWRDDRPEQKYIERDIQLGYSHVCIRDNKIAAVFHFSTNGEPTYDSIDGKWLSDGPYGVVHRLARARYYADGAEAGGGGIGEFCLNWCFEQCRNIRIDTHRDNALMRRLLDKLGYTYCGIILVYGGDERMAFQKIGAAEGSAYENRADRA